jgi:hypothetical protein
LILLVLLIFLWYFFSLRKQIFLTWPFCVISKKKIDNNANKTTDTENLPKYTIYFLITPFVYDGNQCSIKSNYKSKLITSLICDRTSIIHRIFMFPVYLQLFVRSHERRYQTWVGSNIKRWEEHLMVIIRWFVIGYYCK